MEYVAEIPTSVNISLPEWVKTLYAKVKAFLSRNKEAIISGAGTALVLDIITGIIFGFGGAALFAAL